MADPYRVVLHPDLAKERAALETAATKDPNGPEAKQLTQLDKGLDALAEGREAEFDGKRMHSIPSKYAEIGDHAELKIPVTQDVAPNGYVFPGASHRLTYQEAEGTKEDPTPVRRAVAFEPRKGGQPFTVTGQRHGRAVGVGIQELDNARAKESPTGTEITPVRMKLDSELATAIHAGTNPGYEKGGTVKAPTETPVASNAATQDKSKQQQTGLTKQ